MPRVSIGMTIHDRPFEMILWVLHRLKYSGFSDAEIVVTLDKCTQDYSFLEGYLRENFDASQVLVLKEYQRFEWNGFGNPAKAFNTCLAAATGDIFVAMSSDVACSQPVHEAMMKHFNGPHRSAAWTPKIVDTRTGDIYCGNARTFPAPWFLAAPKQAWMDAGGWDEAYLKGFCFEDNDVIARLLSVAQKIRSEENAIALHLDHPQPWYQWPKDSSMTEIRAAWEVNQLLTVEKWMGVPFDDSHPSPFEIIYRPAEDGLWEYSAKKGSETAARAISMTLGVLGTTPL